MLQVIKAEEVRDGEPRWWLADEDRRLDYMKPEHLHLHPRSCAETTHAIVDRPAPTPTPAPGLDLDAVERAERAMTAGPWEAKIYTTHVAGTSQETQWHEAVAGGPSSGTVVCETEWSVFEDESAIGAANIRGIVALRNAAPALIAEVRALRRHYDAAGPDRNLLALLDLYHEREQAALAKLAEAKRLGLEFVALHREAGNCDGWGPFPEMRSKRMAAIAAALEAL